MADEEKEDVVRITYQQLQRLARKQQTEQPKTEPHTTSQEQVAGMPEKQKPKRQRRPDLQIYQPGVLRHSKGNEEQLSAAAVGEPPPLSSPPSAPSHSPDKSQRPSRGPSVEKETPSAIENKVLIEEEKNKSKKKAKRPEMARYVPKIRHQPIKSEMVDEETKGERDPPEFIEHIQECELPAPTQEREPPVGAPQRKVDISQMDVTITVLNDQVSSKPPKARSESAKAGGKRYSASSKRGRCLSNSSDIGTVKDTCLDAYGESVDWAEEVDEELAKMRIQLEEKEEDIKEEEGLLSHVHKERETGHFKEGPRRKEERKKRKAEVAATRKNQDDPSITHAKAVQNDMAKVDSMVFTNSAYRDAEVETESRGPEPKEAQNSNSARGHGKDKKRDSNVGRDHPPPRGHGRESRRDRRERGARGNRDYDDSGLRERSDSKDSVHSNSSQSDRQGRKKYQQQQRDNSSQEHRNSDDKRDLKKPNLKVTFAQEERQVKIKGKRRERWDSGTSEDFSDHEPGHPPRVAGLLHLHNVNIPREPASSQQRRQDGHHPAGAFPPPQREHGHRGRGRGRARGNAHRTLFDPNNPHKPLMVPRLHFQDSSEQHSPEFSPGYGDSHYEYPQVHGGQYHPDYSSSPHGDGMYYNYPVPQYCESESYHDDTYSRDPYYHSGGEQEMMGGRSKSVSNAEKLLREASPLEGHLSNMLSRRIHADELVPKVLALRSELQSRLEQVILLDPDLSNRHNVEQTLWKAGFYQVIEVLRKQLSEERDEKLKTVLLSLLEEGTHFYDNLLGQLEKVFGFSLEQFLDVNILPPEHLSRHVKLALLSAQRSLICLGDIARYRELVNETTSYGKARSFYMKAQHIAPKNGRPYNQLAILALYTRRKLDAVYYYMRSLAASNPFLTARESLMSLFDEARKKGEMQERKRQQEKIKLTKTLHEYSHDDTGHRVEIWISADGSSSLDTIDDMRDILSKLSTVELNKRFVLSFLNVQGKLFTKIGMESFPELSSRMLHELQCLLEHSPAPLGFVRLLQLTTINMFAVQNTKLKNQVVDANCRSLHQEQAIQLGLDMFGLLVSRCALLFEEHLASGAYPIQILSEDLHQLFPGVKVWCDWMVCHASLWNPPPCQRDPHLGPNIDVWQAVADLCNILREVDINHVKLYEVKKEGCDPVILPEDTMLSGFVPLLSLPQEPYFVHCTVDKEIARDCARILKLQTFGDYLCGIEPPMLSYSVEKERYISIAPSDLGEEEKAELVEEGFLLPEDEGDVIIESAGEEEYESGDEEHIKSLKAKKAYLSQRVQEKHQQQQSRQAVLENGDHHCQMELEIRPLLLVPDTNCFIDHLNGIKTLLACGRYTIVVPLVVISELDGLAQGSKEGQYESSGHARMVKKGATAAVEFLEREFEARNRHLKALTSKGTTLQTIAFRSEETEKGTNDDLILSCCLHYCKDTAREFMPREKDAPIRLQRDVVLLTDDRNLRLKAHTRNVPVKDMPGFLEWAKVG